LVPPASAYRIEVITKGRFTVNPALYLKARKAKLARREVTE
jgi:hypothetical protein